jgi:hypothetical protein
VLQRRKRMRRMTRLHHAEGHEERHRLSLGPSYFGPFRERLECIIEESCCPFLLPGSLSH